MEIILRLTPQELAVLTEAMSVFIDVTIDRIDSRRSSHEVAGEKHRRIVACTLLERITGRPAG